MNAAQQLLTEHLDIWAAADIGQKSGRGRASSNAGSVYGIRKLRELIFELAALGRLVDEDIHQSAKLVQLGEVADFIMGQAPPGSECNTNEIGTIFVKTGEFGSQYPEVCEWTTKPLKFAKTGDVLICVVGATVGKLNLAIDCAIGRSVAAIRPVARLESKYTYFALMPFTLRLRAQSRGSAQGVIGKAELNAVQIRLPSVAEQHRIVAKVDELMALCDQLETQHNSATEAHEKLVSHLLGTLAQSQSAADFSANWQRIAAHFDILFTTEASIDALKQTLLQLAVIGKLVPQDPNDEPILKLLKRKEDMSEEGTPFRIPVSWAWARVDEFAQTRLGKMLDKAKNKGTLVRYLRNINVRWFDFDLTDVKEMRFEESELDEFSLRRGDVLICEGGYPGRTAVWDEREVNIYFQKAIHRVRLPNWVNPNYFVKVLRESSDSGRLNTYFTGAGIQHFTGKGLSSFLAPLPPLAEQHRIVAKLDELIALCDGLKIRIADSSQLQQKLADVMVGHAVM